MGWVVSGSVALTPVSDASGSSIRIDLPVDEREYSEVKQAGQEGVAGAATIPVYEATDESALMVDFDYCLISALVGSDPFFVGVYIDRNGSDQLAYGYDVEVGGFPAIVRGNQYNASGAGLVSAISYGAGPTFPVSRVEIRVPAGSTASYVSTFLRE